MYSPNQSKRINEQRLVLLRAFVVSIKPYIDRINRKSAGLEMEIGTYDPESQSQSIRFFLKRAPNDVIDAHLDGNLLKVSGTYWGGRHDFERLVPVIVRELISIEARKQYEAEMAQTYGLIPKHRL